MRAIRTRLIAAAVLLVPFLPVLRAQSLINTVAGAVPNNVPAVSIGFGPRGVFKDSAGNLYISSDSTSSVYKVNPSGQLTTVAGNGTLGFGGDGGLATSSVLSEPTGVFVDAAGNIFIADTLNNRVREIVASTGDIQTVAGNGLEGFGGDGGLPINAELDAPQGVYVDAVGNIFIADTLNNRVREIVASTGDIQTVVGNGLAGFGGDGNPATVAEISNPGSVFVDSVGNIFIADTNNNRIRKVSASTGDIQTVAGDGLPGFSGDGSIAINAELDGPENVFVDTAGNIFIDDSGNNRIRKVVASTGDIQTVAGNGSAGFGGDGGLATSAELSNPLGLFVDTAGNVYLGDYGNSRIREAVASTGDIQTVAGNGSSAFSGDGGLAISAELSSPSGLFVDSAGNIYFGDYGNNRIREVVASSGDIQTVAGNGTSGFAGDSGLATSANLNFPGGVFVDSAGDIFIADSGNNRIREVIASTGKIQTVAGNGTGGFSGDGGPATSAELWSPNSVFVDSAGNIFIADTLNNRVREVVASTGNIQTVAGNGTSGFSGEGGAAISAELNNPSAALVDGAGNIFIADTSNNRVREVVASTGNIQTVAGNGTHGFGGDGGLATSAQLYALKSVFIDPGNDIFIADSNNNRIREVVASTRNIQTVAGNGTAGFTGDGGVSTSAELSFPDGIWGDARGNLLISDSSNNRIRSSLAFATPPGCSLSASSTKVQVGQTVTATLVCTEPATDLLSGTVSWGDGTSPSMSTALASGGSAHLSFTHIYAKASSPTVLISSVVTDTTGNLAGTVSPASVAVTVSAAPVANCSLSANPTKVQVSQTSQTVTATLVCTASANDSLSGTISWGDGTSPSTSTAVASGGTANLSVTHTYVATSSPTDSINANVVDTTTTLVGTVSPSSVGITVFATPAATPSQPSVTGTPGQPVNVSLAFVGGAAEAGALFSTITCTVSPTAACILSPATLTLDSNGNGTMTVSVTPPATAASHLIPLNKGPSWYACSMLLAEMGFVFLCVNFCRVQSRGSTRWSLALLFLIVSILLTMGACGGGSSSSGSSTSSGTSVTYTTNVQIQSNATAQLPSLQANGVFRVVVQYP